MRKPDSPNPGSSTATPADRVWFTGTSNIRRFTCHARQVYLTAEAAPEEFQRTRQDGLTAVRNAALQVPVRSIDCGIAMQNRHLFEALHASDNHEIFFALSDYSVDRSTSLRRVKMQGRLRIAGVQKDVVVHGLVFRDPSDNWILRGERPINMREFGIKPPRRFLGLLRVRDEVVVHFDVVVRPLIDPLGVLVGSLQ